MAILYTDIVLAHDKTNVETKQSTADTKMSLC